MNWRTLEQITEAANTSDKAAMKESGLHWHQIATCTQEEWDEGRPKKVHIRSERCACCRRFCCGVCPLDVDNSCCNDLYRIAYEALMTYQDDPTPANFSKFQVAAGAVENYIVQKTRGMVMDEEKQEKIS